MKPRPPRPHVVRRVIADARGTSAVEYGLIVSLIVIVMIASFVAVADVTTNMWDNVSDTVINAH